MENDYKRFFKVCEGEVTEVNPSEFASVGQKERSPNYYFFKEDEVFIALAKTKKEALVLAEKFDNYKIDRAEHFWRGDYYYCACN